MNKTSYRFKSMGIRSSNIYFYCLEQYYGKVVPTEKYLFYTSIYVNYKCVYTQELAVLFTLKESRIGKQGGNFMYYKYSFS